MYGPLIMQDCGCTREECPEVESIMRSMHGGLLDAISKKEFKRSAKEAYEYLQAGKRRFNEVGTINGSSSRSNSCASYEAIQ